MMYFVSDLDKTLIFSNKENDLNIQDFICVEHYDDGGEITYMTRQGFELFNEVLSKSIFIPCTMRNLRQTLRIAPIKEYNPKYIICTNGCEIYIDGELDVEWEDKVRSLIPKNETLSLVNKIESQGLSYIECRNVNDFYIAIKYEKSFINSKDFKKEISIIRNIIPSNYNFQQDKHKIFLLNKCVDKANAIDYLKNKYLEDEGILVAGDSNADEMMTKLDYVKAFIPCHATFQNEYAYRTFNRGIASTKELLLEVLKEL